jgi:hypothetical protein
MVPIEIAAAQAIRAADSSATIVTGGTSGDDSSIGFPYNVTLGRGVGPYIDGVGIHPYGVAPSAFASAVSQVSDETDKPVYITEWATNNATDLEEAMLSSATNTRMFDAYQYQNQPGDTQYGLINNGLWTTFAQYSTQ